MRRQKAVFLLAAAAILFNASEVSLADIGIYRAPTLLDAPSALLPPEAMEAKIEALDAPELRRAEAEKNYWVGPIWSMSGGMIAARYQDSDFVAQRSLSQELDYVQKKSLRKVMSIRNSRTRSFEINRLSPAEKYDLLVGDLDATLTQSIWAEIRRFYDSDRLTGWMGLCEGLAGASAVYSEPESDVKVLAADGQTQITFSRDDLKGLSSLLWSSYVAQLPVAGSRCNVSLNPKYDKTTEMGEDCFNINPAVWHMAALNLVGMKKGPLLMDRTVDAEVWNVPVRAYQFEYFNPKSGSKTKTLADAIIPLESYTKDPFRGHRSAEATQLVGVHMSVRWSHRDVSGISQITGGAYDFTLDYDLEISSDGRIVGGEWRSFIHPDFLWTIPAGYQALSVGDHLLGANAKWESGTIPADWNKAILQSSSAMQPMAKIVDHLMELSVQKK